MWPANQNWPKKNSMKSLDLQKSSRLMYHSLSHFSPVLVREDQEHFNRSILPGLFFDERSNSNGQQFGQLRKFTKFNFTKFFANPKNPRSKPCKWQGCLNHLKVRHATWGTLASLDGTWHQLASKSFPWKVLPSLLRRTYVFPKKNPGMKH